MIKIRIDGGLGNQLFQYATAFALAKNLKTDMSVDISAAVNYKVHPLRLTELNCSAPFDEKLPLIERFLLHPRLIQFSSKVISRYYLEPNLKYNKSLQETADNKLLIGYFQSEQYFKNYRAELLKEFFPQREFSSYQQSLIKKIKNGNSLSIHIRRGDYVTNLDANNTHGICNQEYFSKAIQYLVKQKKISEKTKVFIFSDDIKWCKENLKFLYETEFVNGDINCPELDMWLMSYCTHNIISNSTFSWWGAWLNTNSNKCVIAPKQWFKTLHSSTDIVPKQWKRL